jgi:tetratricopeptide (TPR) repeat protein
MNLFPQSLVYSPAFDRFRAIDNSIAVDLAERSMAKMRLGSPAMLNAEKGSLARNIGRLYSEMGKSDRAARYLGEALWYDPINPEALTDLGFLLANSGDCQLASNVLRISIRVSPASYYAHLFLGQALACQSLWPSAADEYQRAAKIRSSAATLMQVAMLRIKGGETQKAVGVLKEIMANFSGTPEYNQAQTLLASLNK